MMYPEEIEMVKTILQQAGRITAAQLALFTGPQLVPFLSLKSIVDGYVLAAENQVRLMAKKEQHKSRLN